MGGSSSSQKDDPDVPEEIKTNDDDDDEEYCHALAMALYHDTCPLTVGLYVPWGRCKDNLLDKIKIHLKNSEGKQELIRKSWTFKEHLNKSEWHKKEVGKTGILRGWDLFNIMLLMLFYNPVITKMHEERKSIHFVFVRFSAWECTGSDQLWAGLVTTLCDRIENEFGLIPLSIYRALHKKIQKKNLETEWESKNILHFIPIGIVLCMFSLVLFVCVFISYQVFTWMLGIALAVFGLWAAKPLITVLEVIKNLIVTQRVKVLRKLKTKNMSSQLGFMADVKKEIEIITSYLQLMEIFQKQKIRVIIEIIKLDNCMPNRVVEVLNAINILLSNPDAPFISILAVDPSIIVECVEKSDQLKGMANNGYLFLNRVVTLSFSIPQMSEKSISYHLNHIIDGKKTLIGYKKNSIPSASSKCEPLLAVKTDSNNQHYKEQEQKANNLVKEALNSLKFGTCLKCITGNVINMRRLVTSIIITVRLMIKDNKNIKPDKVSKWVILAAQWPCTLSWILQCIEDEQQSTKSENSSYSNTFLWDVYEKSLETMHVNRKGLKQLLELDGDPDIFYDLLNDAKFTVEDANTFLPFTINLDCTIKRKIELLQGSYNFLRFKKEKILTRKFLLGMSTDAVCEKMSELKILPENLPQYRNLIKKNNLNGKALLYTDNKEIRNVLRMNLGDWVEFSTNFLRLPTPNILF